MSAGVLYVRAGLSGIPRSEISTLFPSLARRFSADEFMAPYFRGARPLWRRATQEYRDRNAGGAIARLIAKLPNSLKSSHPTHTFVGTSGLADILNLHDWTRSCFWPIARLAETSDGKMLLWGCIAESPGFSTVHAAQEHLRLTRRHLIRLLYRWDVQDKDGRTHSIMAPEIPGCSRSFWKFYAMYEDAGLLEKGVLFGKEYLLVHSIREALRIETQILRQTPRFVSCDRSFCLTCSLRAY